MLLEVVVVDAAGCCGCLSHNTEPVRLFGFDAKPLSRFSPSLITPSSLFSQKLKNGIKLEMYKSGVT